MQYEVEIGDRLRSNTVVRSGEGLAVEIDGRSWHVDAARIDPRTMSLLVAGVAPERHARLTLSREVVFSSGPAASQLIVHVGTKPFAVTVNARRRRQDVPAAGRVRGAVPGGSGPQRILAPMPGKVVRVLVRAGDVVGARQPLVVVEAMKMENELRAGRDGRVAAIHVQEGMSVDSGALMVVIE
jgi:biotin carboxyl carrier protein